MLRYFEKFLNKDLGCEHLKFFIDVVVFAIKTKREI